MELYDKPGIIILNNNSVIRTTKIKKYITKNKIEYKNIQYLEVISDDFREVERSLKELENSYLGLGPIKDKQFSNKQETNTEIKYLFWDKIGKGWLISKDENASEWPWQNEIGNRFLFIDSTKENETILEAETRLFNKALKI